MKKKLSLLALISLVVLVLDQLTKIYVHSNFQLHESIPVIDGFFNFTYVRNEGAAFGMLQNAPYFFRKIFFILITPVALAGIFYFLKNTEENDHLQIGSLALIFSGAIGNYIDRIRLEYVIDFLDFYIKDAHYPAFNIADSAIVVGVVFIFISSLIEERRKKQES